MVVFLQKMMMLLVLELPLVLVLWVLDLESF
jgi:hypothetical protein